MRLNELEKALEGLFAKCAYDAGYALSVYSVCLVLVRHLATGLPVAQRQALAIELYKLADALAESEPPDD